MATMSGKGGLFKISTVTFHVRSWDARVNADLPDATDSATAAGWKSHVVGRKSVVIRLSGWVDSADLPDAKIQAGTVLSTVSLTLGNGTTAVSAASASVMSLSYGAPIGSGDTCPFEAEILVNGAFGSLT